MPGSKVHAAYERHKTATTASEARALGASRSMIKYDVGKRYVAVHDQPAVVVLALAATLAPLVEAWCADDSELEKVGELRGRRVIRYTSADDLSTPSTIKRALDDIRSRSGVHLHGSIPCTPWTAWQRTNHSNAKPETRERTLSDHQVSLEYVKTFGCLGKATLARGGSISFEWPRRCEGWKEEVVTTMMNELKLEPIEIGGCAVGVRSKSGDPILKPWRIAVTPQHMKQALDCLRCKGAMKTFLALEARQLARPSTPNSFATLFMTAWMHMSRHMPCRPPGHMLNHWRRWCQVACLSPVNACALQAVATAIPVIASALIVLLLVQEFKTS